MTTDLLGASVKRLEDPGLLTGRSGFVADMSLPGMAHMEILRARHAHARIDRIDLSAALRMPGVLAAITGADLVDKIMPLPCMWVPGGVDSHFPSHPLGVPGAGAVLTTDRVRFIGDQVAAVVAETQMQAHDALSAIEVDYELLPVVLDAERALEHGQPQLHDKVPGNLNAIWSCGDREATDRAIAAAEVTVELSSVNQRTLNSPIEPRAAIGVYEPGTGQYTLYATTQSPHNHRLLLAVFVLGIPVNKLRVVAPNIGGSFGTKGYLYPEMPLVLHLASQLGRPVMWTDTRTGLHNSTVQGRDHAVSAVLAGTRDGRITAVRCTSHANLGAYPSTIGPGVATSLFGRSLTGPYAIPCAFCEVRTVFTNKVPLGAQRGCGRAEATFVMERLVDRYAATIGMDPAEVRRRNLVPKDRFPYDNTLGWTYDSGDYPAAFEQALERVGYGSMGPARREARTRGKRLGVGMASFVAITGIGPSYRMSREGMLGGAWESANLRISPTGEVTLAVGSKSQGQSHETVFAQILAEELGIDPQKVQFDDGDTERTPYGQGTYGSRTLSVGGPAVHSVARQAREKLLRMAAHQFGVDVDDVVYADGRMSVRGDPSQTRTLREVALETWYGWNLPAGMEPALDFTVHLDPPDFNYPFGTHVAVVEVDDRTGEVDVVRYVAVHDVGNAVNPMVVDGQMHGGIAHGIGQALLEEAVYGPDGRLLTGNLDEYALPRATRLPNFEISSTVTPTPHNVLGAKGAGEVGTVGAAAAVVNAVCDALADLGVVHIEMPVTPEKVWQAVGAASRSRLDAGDEGPHGG
jgi:aerobic carbon-monoxide dehydrogenase large subunit